MSSLAPPRVAHFYTSGSFATANGYLTYSIVDEIPPGYVFRMRSFCSTAAPAGGEILQEGRLFWTQGTSVAYPKIHYVGTRAALSGVANLPGMAYWSGDIIVPPCLIGAQWFKNAAVQSLACSLTCSGVLIPRGELVL